MSIGIIIFVISVVISIIKAVIDNSDKERDPLSRKSKLKMMMASSAKSRKACGR